MKNKEITLKPDGINSQIVNNAPMSIMITDRKGDIVFVNKYFNRISKHKNPLGKNIFSMPFFVREKLSNAYKILLSRGITFAKDKCVSADKTGYLNIVAVPLRGESGKIDGALSMATDVTQIISAKMELKKTNEKLKKMVAERTRQLVKINQKLEKSLKLKSQFISEASHELRTPLSIARLNLELFTGQFPCEGVNCSSKDSLLETLDSINNEISKMSDILSDITFFSAIDEGSVGKITLEKINLGKLAENISKRLESLAREKNISITLKKGAQDIIIRADRIKLEKLFLNIVGNSIKYGKKKGWVKIKLEPGLENKFVKIIISDNGMGISKKDLPHIFDRFYRTSLSRKSGEGGFGLGLTICKWIIEQHKGSISVDSAVDRGSVFTIKLPINK